MAVTPFNAALSAGGYTVPAGKHAVFNVNFANSSGNMTIAGTNAAAPPSTGGASFGPFVATSGQVIAGASSPTGLISGFLYDN